MQYWQMRERVVDLKAFDDLVEEWYRLRVTDVTSVSTASARLANVQSTIILWNLPLACSGVDSESSYTAAVRKARALIAIGLGVTPGVGHP